MILSQLIAIALAGAFLTGLTRNAKIARIVALVASLGVLGLSLTLLPLFNTGAAGFQFVERYDLIPSFRIQYYLGLDGISLWMVLLTAILFPLVVLGSWSSIDRGVSAYFALMLLLEAAVIGAFVALDLFLFYIFWELMLIPMFFIIGIWGGEKRIYATVKFVLFTMAGSLLMLVAILYLAGQAGSFAYTDLLVTPIGGIAGELLFGAFALSFLIKVPAFPLHTWLPDAHTEAPAGGSVVLAGVLLKLGAYGLIRFNLPLFPEASALFAPLMIALGLVGIVHGAMAAAVQPDMKRLVAYSSVSHMGFILLGIFSFTRSGLQGSVIQMVNHGLSTGALFLLVGMIYDRTHTRRIADYGGMAKTLPVFSFFFLFATLASAGLPGLNGFIGEFLILASAFRVAPWMGMVGVSGVVLGAWYLLRLYGRVFFGPVQAIPVPSGPHLPSHAPVSSGHPVSAGDTPGEERDTPGEKGHILKDLNLREIVLMAPLLALMLYLGVAPGSLLQSMENSIRSNVLEKLTANHATSIDRLQTSIARGETTK